MTEINGTLELRHADGTVTGGHFTQDTANERGVGDRFEHAGLTWVVVAVETRDGRPHVIAEPAA